MQFTNYVVCIDFFLTEFIENVFLRQLSTHEDSKAIKVVAFFVF